MTDTIKKGTVLWAIQNIKFEKDAKNSITRGKAYPIDDVTGRTIYLLNDMGEGHSFDTHKNDTAYWGKFFSLTPPEDKGVQTEGKSEELRLLVELAEMSEYIFMMWKGEGDFTDVEFSHVTEAAFIELLAEVHEHIALKAHQKGEK